MDMSRRVVITLAVLLTGSIGGNIFFFFQNKDLNDDRVYQRNQYLERIESLEAENEQWFEIQGLDFEPVVNNSNNGHIAVKIDIFSFNPNFSIEIECSYAARQYPINNSHGRPVSIEEIRQYNLSPYVNRITDEVFKDNLFTSDFTNLDLAFYADCRRKDSGQK